MSRAALLSFLAPPLCAGCGRHARRGLALCPACQASLRWLGPEPLAGRAVALWAPVAYEGAAAALVRGLKFRGALPLAGVMASHIAANAPPSVLAAPGSALVPVPLHRARRRRRGFNQAERIAAALGTRTGQGVCDCLERVGSPVTQMGRDRDERLRAIGGTVRLRPGVDAPRTATLVDDVATTGATLSACAEALRRGGTAEITAVAYARTPGR